MSDTPKHTPGPWEVEHILNAIAPSVVSVADWENDSLTEKDAEVCIMGQCSDLDEAEANARLIAAAPEMLEALKGLQAILESAESNASGNPEWAWVSARINAARAAVAKATGAA